jgi:hypothetical protein
MSVAAAAAALRDADEALAAGQVIRAEALEALINALEGENWRVVYRAKDPHGERVVLEDPAGRSGNLMDVANAVLREAVA